MPVDGRDEEHVRASAELAKNLVFVRHGALVRRSLPMVRGRCFALETHGVQVACRIYPDRPNACRELIAGSPECLESRRLRGVI